MILVVGATGDLGRLVVHQLLEKETSVRVLVRRGSSYDDLVHAGAEAVLGDLKDPASLEAACARVDAVFTTANAAGRGGEDTVESVDRQGNASLVHAAATAGVRHFVFTSALGAGVGSPSEFLRAKGETEERVRNSGMNWSVLQPNGYMDTFFPMVVGGPALAGRPVVLVGEGQRRHSFVARRDVAAFAVAALDDKRAHGQTLVIGGPEAISWRGVVAAYERELGRSLQVETVPPGDPVPGLPGFVSDLLAALETYDSPTEMTEVCAMYGVTPTPLGEFIREAVAPHREAVS